MAAAIRRIQEREAHQRDYKTSALIHVELDKKNHEWQRKVINRLIDSIKSAIVEEDQSDLRIWAAIDRNYNDFVESNEKGRKAGLIDIKMPPREDIMDEIRNIFNPKNHNYSVQIVNSDEQVESLLDEETGELRLDTAANIFIGGNILDRGITIKNMLCFFYGRNPQKFQQDTVLQHARMYGARSKEDMAVTRLHTTSKIYGVLVRMNDLDNQLREWFLQGNDKNDMNAIFVGYDSDIKPCSPQKIKASNTLTLKTQMRMVPAGFWTGSNSAIKNTIAKIDALIKDSPNYTKQDKDGFFEIDKTSVETILKLIESTFVYDDKHNNLDRKNDIKEMLCALEYCTSKSNGKLYALHRTGRQMNRLRANGGYIDAPDDGRTDIRPARAKAIDMPVITLIRQEGKKCKGPDTNENIGWNDAPFYWPVFMSQQNIDPVMYSIEQGRKRRTAVTDAPNILDGIDPSEVLSLTMPGTLINDFEEPGTEYGKDRYIVETREICETTASRYLEKDEEGNYKINPKVHFDKEHDHGIYSRNHNVFPFVLKPYKYLLLRNRRDASADLMLIELYPSEEWAMEPLVNINKNGDLCDRADNVLIHTRDTIYDKDMNKTVVDDETVAMWIIHFRLKKVLKFQPCTIDWDKIFGTEPEE